MCSSIADILESLDSSSSDGLTPPPSPFPGHSQQATCMSPPRKVHFQDTIIEVHIESLAALTDAEKEKLWFTETEIEGFKVKARALCEDIKLGVTEEENTRGLELRLCQERQRRKFMILQAILRAQKRFKDSKHLSNIARKCSVWSKAVAAILAQRDYCLLYEPARISSVPAFPAMGDYPLPFKAKDPCTIPVKRPRSPVPHQRHVRPRPAPFAAPC